MKSPFHSIRWRLQAWHGLILLVVIVAFCLMAYRVASDNLERRIDRDLFQTERNLAHALMDTAGGGGGRHHGPPPPVALLQHLRSGETSSLPGSVATLFQGTDPGFAYFRLSDADGRVLLESPNVPADIAQPPPPSGDFSEEVRTAGHRREVAKSFREGLRSVVGRDIQPELDDLRRLALSLAASGLGVWLLGLLGGWWLAGRAIQPIAAISRTATRIAEGNLEERITPAGTDSELDQLAGVLNQTFARLHTAFERQRRFTADASHELRTPVTILLSETQRVLKRERSAAEYREALQTCQDTAGRMRRLIEDLLLLARHEAEEARREPVDVATIAAATVAQLAPLATEKNVSVAQELAPAPCRGDSAALAILASNLISNAIQHNRAGGKVRVSSRLEDGRAVLEVTDDGPGIPAGDLPHIFQRFHRADKARTGTSGHTGLGLAIAKAIADQHQGSLTGENNADHGARFVARFPAA